MAAAPAPLAPLPLAAGRADAGRDASLRSSAGLVSAQGFLAASEDFSACPASSAGSRAQSPKPLRTPMPCRQQAFAQPALHLCSCRRAWGVSLPPAPGTPMLQPLASAGDSHPYTGKGTGQEPAEGIKCPFRTVPDPKEELPSALIKPQARQADLLSLAGWQPLSDPLLLLLPFLWIPLYPTAHSPETSLLAVGRWKRVLSDGWGLLHEAMPVCMCINFFCICYLT